MNCGYFSRKGKMDLVQKRGESIVSTTCMQTITIGGGEGLGNNYGSKRRDNHRKGCMTDFFSLGKTSKIVTAKEMKMKKT